MRRAGRILGGLLLAALLCLLTACAEESFESADCAISVSLSGRGLTSTVTLRFENRTAAPLTLLVRDIALNGECTGYTARYEAAPGATERAVSFRRSALAPVTACDVGVAVLNADNGALCETTLRVCPYGESAARLPGLADFPDATAAMDNELASLAILPGPDGLPNQRVLWLFNKSDQLLRLHIDRILADGQLTETALVVQALPHTGQYAELTLPAPIPATLTLSLNVYLAADGDTPALRETYAYRPLNPVSVSTMVPVNTPRPQIGTVTIRKSGPINVREGDSTDTKKVGSAKAGKTYPCFGVSPNGWYLIRLEDGTEGYVTGTLSTLQRQ